MQVDTFRKDMVAAHANGLKSSIHALEVQVTILKQLFTASSKADEDEEADEAVASGHSSADEDEDEDLAPKKAAPKKKAAVNFGDDEDEEEEVAPPKAAAKAKKITADQVNDACKAHAAENGIKVTKALLLKKFKTMSITEIDPSKYADVIKALEA